MSTARRLRSAARPLVSALRYLRHVPERWLHSARRRRLLDRLRAAGRPHSVLFICHGNINRSAYAAAAFERAVWRGDQAPVRVASAGFIGPGRPASELARAVAAARGVDLSAHVSRPLDLSELRETGLIVVMDARQRRAIHRLIGRRTGVILLGDLDPQPIDRRTVRDPYGHTRETFEVVFSRIDRCLAQLASVVIDREEAGLTGSQDAEQLSHQDRP